MYPAVVSSALDPVLSGRGGGVRVKVNTDTYLISHTVMGASLKTYGGSGCY